MLAQSSGQRNPVSYPRSGTISLPMLLYTRFACRFAGMAALTLFAERGANATTAPVNISGTAAPGVTPIAGHEVSVVAERPAYFTSSNEQNQAVQGEFLNALPSGRAVAESLELIPGATYTKTGVTFGGASAAENAWILDGVDVGDVSLNVVNVNPPVQFLDRIEVLTAGYQADTGKALGGVIRMVTKSGTNDLKGTLFADLETDGWTGAPPRNPAKGQAISASTTLDRSLKSGLEIGGPLVQDKLWLWLGVSTTHERRTVLRVVDRRADDDRDGIPDRTNQDLDGDGIFDDAYFPVTIQEWNRWDRYWQPAARLTWQPGAGRSLSLSYLGTIRRYWGAALDSDTELRDRPSVFLRELNDSRAVFSLQYTAPIGQRFTVEAAVGAFFQVAGQHPLTEEGHGPPWEVRFFFERPHPEFLAYNVPPQGNVIDVVEIPSLHYRYGGGLDADRRSMRVQERIALGGFASALGRHDWKIGAELKQSTIRSTFRWTTGKKYGFIGTTDCIDTGEEQYVFVDANPNMDPAAIQRGHQVREAIELDHSYYVVDNWTPVPDLSLNLGMRFTHQEVQVQSGQIVAATGRPWRWDDGYAPRVGAAYDWTGRGKSKVSAFFGRFYGDLTTSLAEYAVPQGGVAFRKSIDPPVSPPCNKPQPPWIYLTWAGARQQRTTYDLQTDTWSGVEELRGAFHDEFLFSYEHEPAPNWTARIAFQRKYLMRTIEDMSLGTSHYDIVNPGYGAARRVQTYYAWPATAYVEVPRPERSFTSWQIVLERRLAGGWQGLLSYVWTRNHGNYPGVINEDYGHPLPNLQRDYDEPGRFANGFGDLPVTRRHTIKLDASYERSLGRFGAWTTGAGVRARSGTFTSAWGDVNPAFEETGQVFLAPRGTCGQTPWNYWANLRFKYSVPLHGGNRLSLIVDLFNVFNVKQTATVDERVVLGPADGMADPLRTDGAVYGGRSFTFAELKRHLIGGNPDDPVAKAIYENYMNGDPTDDHLFAPNLQSYRPYLYDAVSNPNGYLAQADHTRWLVLNPNYGRPTSYTDPFRMRIGLEYTFGGAPARLAQGVTPEGSHEERVPAGNR